MHQNLFKGQYLIPSSMGYNYTASQITYVGKDEELWDSPSHDEKVFRVINPFVQTCFVDYELQQLNQRNLIQDISEVKFYRCIYRKGAKFHRGTHISPKFGIQSVMINFERTHCYFSYKGKFYKSKVWTDKLDVVYGACAGSQYGEYDGKL